MRAKDGPPGLPRLRTRALARRQGARATHRPGPPTPGPPAAPYPLRESTLASRPKSLLMNRSSFSTCGVARPFFGHQAHGNRHGLRRVDGAHDHARRRGEGRHAHGEREAPLLADEALGVGVGAQNGDRRGQAVLAVEVHDGLVEVVERRAVGHRVRRQILDGHRLPLGQRVVLGEEGAHGQGAHGPAVAVGVLVAPHGDDGVQGARMQLRQSLLAQADGEAHLGAHAQGQKPLQARLHGALSSERQYDQREADIVAQRRVGHGLVGGERLDLVERGNRAERVLVQLATEGCGDGPLAVADEKRSAQLGFQLDQGLGNRLHRHALLARGAREAAKLDNRAEITELSNVHTCFHLRASRPPRRWQGALRCVPMAYSLRISIRTLRRAKAPRGPFLNFCLRAGSRNANGRDVRARKTPRDGAPA